MIGLMDAARRLKCGKFCELLARNGAAGTARILPLGLFLGQLNPSPRDLDQVCPVLLVDMFCHVETFGRAIKVEVAFRFHV